MGAGPASISERLHAAGHRLTPQRALVLAAVEALGHATPEEVYATVREQSSAISLSTVYRTLELLDGLGLIRHAHLSDRAPTYHAHGEHEHVHLVCRGCQQVISVDADRIAASWRGVLDEAGFEPDYGHLTVFGRCVVCRSRGMVPEGDDVG
ncbi:MAG: transcriptional repressor [Marmoricola sp.]